MTTSWKNLGGCRACPWPVSISIGWFSEGVASEVGSDTVECECVECELAAVEIDVLSFLNGLPRAFAPHFTDCFRDSALRESVEDLIDEVSELLDFAIEKKWE